MDNYPTCGSPKPFARPPLRLVSIVTAIDKRGGTGR
jgi:hypothetical protein